MTHQKRLSAPKHYPIERKDEKYVSTTEGSRGSNSAIPAVLFLRDVIEYAETEKEAKKIVRNGDVLRNGDPVRNIQDGLGTLDLVEIPETEEKFRVLKNGDNLDFVPTESGKSMGKIVDKTKEGDRFVYRLHNGENYSSKDEFDTQNTLVFDEGTEEIELREGGKALVARGKHSGDVAEVKSIERRGMNPDTAVIEINNQFETQLENLIAVTGTEIE